MAFAPLRQTLHRDASQVVLGVGRIEDDLRLAASLADTALPLAAVGLIVTPLQRFGSELGAMADGFLGPSQWEPSVTVMPDYGPSTSEVMQSLQRHAATDIDYPMAQAYAGCLVAQRCLEVAASSEPHMLRQAANQLDFTTFYGRFRIEPLSGRQVGHAMPVVQWQNRKKIVVWPPGMRQQRAVPWR
jgi:ABC-type branched-subunit amino acid transport system substrate-binding protein